MKQFFLFSAALFLNYVGLSQASYSLAADFNESDYITGTIILKVKDNYRHFCNENGINIPGIEKRFNRIGLTSVNKKFKDEKPPREKHNAFGQAYADLSLIYECKYSQSIPIESAINELLTSGFFVYAEPHFIPKPDYTTNDPQANIGQQYHLNRIDCYNAWDISKGDSSVIIGITDTGVELNHPDLQGNIKYNYADPINGSDDDSDGYIDNFRGWDLGMNDNDPTWQGSVHGVHVSGVAAAHTDNNVGVAGVGFKSKFLPIKISDAGGSLVSAYEGIKYAADHNCKIINCSWGGGSGGQYGQDICTYATINKDALVVAAAGNNGIEQNFYPAAYNYVLAVANTQSTDVKYSSSNFGHFVDVCAPGTQINATWSGGGYSQQTGTSMAAPVAAGALAIIRHHYPTYTALQAAERLITTTDDIYSLNSGLADKLGTGRVNLFKALNNPLSQSVVFDDVTIKDKNDEIYLNNDTLFISGKFTNYLAPTAALNATLVSLSSQAVAINNIISLGVINTLSSKTNTSNPFTFKLNGTFSNNTAINFRLDMKDGSYTKSQFFTVLANADYINIYINDVGTTSTSKGLIGYNQNNQSQGLGFIYGGESILYDGGLLIGVDTTKVSDCVRFNSINEVDFSPQISVHRVVGSPKSDFDTYAKFNDATSSTIIGLEVEQRNFAWATPPDKKYVIWEYIIKNTSSVTYTDLYVGVFADWDITATTFTLNKSAYDATNKMGYSWSTNSLGQYAGIKLLSASAQPVFYAIDNIGGGNGGVDIFSEPYTTAKKYKTLSTNRFTAGGSGSGNDVCNVMSSGPHNIAPGQYAVVAFALIAGNDLADIQNSAASAQAKYNIVATADVGIKKQTTLNTNNIIIYPNPVENTLFISTKQANIINEVEILNLLGQVVLKCPFDENINVSQLAKGCYSLKIHLNSKEIYYSKFIKE